MAAAASTRCAAGVRHCGQRARQALDPLIESFVSGIAVEQRERWTGDPALGERLRALCEVARARWPELFDAQALLRALATHAREPAELAGMHAAELTLALACARGDAAALRAFELEHGKDIAIALTRAGVAPAAIDDSAQLVRARLFVGPSPRIAAYSGRGALANWVRTTAVRVAISGRRGRAPLDRAVASLPSRSGATSEPELSWLRQRYQAQFKQAFDDAVAALDDDDRALLRFKFLDGLTLDELGRLYGTHRATVARRVARVREALLASMRRDLGVAIGAERHRIDSIVELLDSELDLSLSRLFAARPPA